ncbi:DivIVA domain-containing protein [Deinococcus malanensis]|uniref:DivIVA domain-containing protein n=1 Tax=Deinococcus malanensis TaxID=1706855 RepID=UPI0036458D69
MRAFLTQIADQLEDMLQTQHTQSEYLQELERQIEEQRQAEDEIRRAVVAAERIGHELRENAVRESDLLVAQATTQRESLLREAEARNVELEAQYGARMAALEGRSAPASLNSKRSTTSWFWNVSAFRPSASPRWNAPTWSVMPN